MVKQLIVHLKTHLDNGKFTSKKCKMLSNITNVSDRNLFFLKKH